MRRGRRLQTIAAQCAGDLMKHGVADDLRASQVAAGLFGRAGGQVAGPRMAVLGLAAGGEAEPLLRSLVGLHLGHIATRHAFRWLV